MDLRFELRLLDSGGGSVLSVYGKQFKPRELIIDAWMTELKRMMTDKLIIHSETLPFETYVPANADKLIGHISDKGKSRKYKFFYPNNSNKFWRILSGLIGHQLAFFEGDESVAERHMLSRKLNFSNKRYGAYHLPTE